MENSMKKLLLLSAVVALSGCACLDGMCGGEEDVDPVVTYRTTTNTKNCDYFDGKTCFRYVRRYEEPREVVRYREPRVVYRDVPCETRSCARVVSSCASQPSSPCQPTIRETREPVEVIYKKTTYRTVYEPKTYEDVSYEKEPYTKPSCNDCSL